MKRLIFAGNWKMHLGPAEAEDFVTHFLAGYAGTPDRNVWLFPPAVSLAVVARGLGRRPRLLAGVQNVHWEAKGAFTGEISVPMAVEAGARAALVGHSERRHIFGETDEQVARKVRAVLAADLIAVLCVGETIAERERNITLDVVRRQLEALDDVEPDALTRVVIAYEPVWAIGTGRNATPADAAEVHAAIREELASRGLPTPGARVLYGGSVKPENVRALIAEPEIDGVLVGGASIDLTSWLKIVHADPD